MDKGVVVKNIDYDLEGRLGFESYTDRTRDEVLNALPRNIRIHPSYYEDWLEEDETREDFVDTLNNRFQKAVEETSGWLCIGFSYEFESKDFGFIKETFKEPPLAETLKQQSEWMEKHKIR